MKQGYTHITMVIDRSGSMSAVQTDAQGAVNHFIEEQKKVAGFCTLKLVDFDAPGTSPDWCKTVHDGDIQAASHYSLQPRGNTALLDAVGMTLTQTGEWLLALADDDKPEKLIFVVQTDGQENSSKDWTWDKLREVIKRQTEDYDWQFVFLGMGPDTWNQAHQMGIQNVVRASGSGISHAHTHSVMSAYVADYRTDHTHNLAATNVTVDAQGRVFDDDGNEIDPNTGRRLDA